MLPHYLVKFKCSTVQRFISDQFEVGYRLVGHTESVTAADAVYVDGRLLIVSASADCSLRIWRRSEDMAGKILQDI